MCVLGCKESIQTGCDCELPPACLREGASYALNAYHIVMLKYHNPAVTKRVQATKLTVQADNNDDSDNSGEFDATLERAEEQRRQKVG